jgi:threonine/homoserine/homoserine lactone efflux protein
MPMGSAPMLSMDAGIGPWLGFVGIMAVGQFSPGPDLVLITRTALASGRAAGCRMAAGIATGLMVHAGLAVSGVVLAMAGDGWLRIAMTVAAALYLAYLGTALLRSRGLMEFSPPDGMKAGHPFRQGLMCNLLNPKVAIFLAAVTMPFLADGRGGGWVLGLWAIVVIEGFTLWVLWVWLLQWQALRQAYFRKSKWLDRGFGAALWVLALVLAVDVVRTA